MNRFFLSSLHRFSLFALTAATVIILSLAGCNQQQQQQATQASPPPAPPQGFTYDFEGSLQLPADWTVEGDVTVDDKEAFKGAHSLVLSRTQPDADKPCSVVTSSFKTVPGLWNITGEIKPDLYSPDSSFDGQVILECLDATGKVINQITVSDVFGKNGWNAFGGQFEIPKGTDSSRFHVQLNKTYGKLWVDELAASYIGEAPHKYVDRLVFSTGGAGEFTLSHRLARGEPERSRAGGASRR